MDVDREAEILKDRERQIKKQGTRIPRGVRDERTMDKFLDDEYKKKGLDRKDPFKPKKKEEYRRAGKYTKTRIMNSKERRDLVQPLAKDGYSNEEFTKLYGHNPYHNTERDRARRKRPSQRR